MHRNHNSYKSRIPPRRSTQLEGTLDWGDLKRYGPNSLPTWQGPHHVCAHKASMSAKQSRSFQKLLDDSQLSPKMLYPT
ncbi:hypothetical protein HanXRQr2_Chr02g0083361 [Helianthus annuus]|uniref:Uncharacterized protein n=1 Tax=Helianthus annuus TaxID=4232 RepID=A0A9K3JRI5_HELAN|nr:hypothetical protein HanXRQr2_Chr02g0083361 [Helianthus annuus]